MSLGKALRAKPITRLEGGTRSERADDFVAVEEPLEIRLAGRAVAVIMRTPGHDRELAAGFLVTEGLVRRRDEVLDLMRCTGGRTHAAGAGNENILDVLLAPGVAVDFARLTRHVFTSSSCGICSRASIEAVRGEFPPIAVPLSPRREVLAVLPERLRAAQAAFEAQSARIAAIGAKLPGA